MILLPSVHAISDLKQEVGEVMLGFCSIDVQFCRR